MPLILLFLISLAPLREVSFVWSSPSRRRHSTHRLGVLPMDLIHVEFPFHVHFSIRPCDVAHGFAKTQLPLSPGA
jgi:hypothetical protein